MATDKPKVLVLGGCGFIGRHIVAELVEKELAGSVCVVDKVPPQIAWLGPQHQKVFDHHTVSFQSANLINQASCVNAFGDCDWDWVINAAGETKTGQVDPVYREGIVRLSTNCATEAAKKKVKMYVEISSGQMSSSEKNGHKESEDASPWTRTAKFKLQAEKEIRAIPDLNWIIVRPAIAYGPSDKLGITPRLIFGAVYRHLGEPMKLLWDQSLITNTVHVTDLARSIVWLCQRGRTGEIYNVVDEGNTTQGHISNIVSDIFNINHDYFGNTLSNFAKTDASGLVNEINEKHLAPWAAVCSADGIDNTPLTPYLDQDAIHHCHLHLNGSKIREAGFTFSVPKPTQENLMQVIKEFIDMKVFPGTALPPAINK